MDIVSVDPTNSVGLSSTYAPDQTVQFDQSFFLTEQGYSFPFTQAYAGLKDTAINNYSNLYLTKTDTLTSNISIQPLDPLPVNGFCTYLATYETPDILDTTKFVVVEEPPITVKSANISLSGVYQGLDNRSLFEIIFVDNLFCQVKHSYKGIDRYLTAENGFLLFELSNNYSGPSLTNSQLFYYAYDQDNNALVLSKTFIDNTGNSVCLFVGYTPGPYPAYIPTGPNATSGITFYDPIQGSNTPFPPTCIFRTTPRPGDVTEATLYDAWVSYEKDFHTNTQNINPDRSIQSVESNLLINAQYSNIQNDGTLNVNVLSLKNTATPENLQGRGNPFQKNRSTFLDEGDANSRTYNKLFTGSKQIKGDDNITLGYESYTTGVTLPADKITYFHTPQILYPFIQINVADAGFIEAGAIAGDHPMKSDKIFKKLASAKYTSPFGTVTDETDGTFLCSWLSGSADINTKPVWMDRYYNPQLTSYVAALTTASVNYTSTFDTLTNGVSAAVFDKLSDLTLQPGAYYAYQHIGNSYVNQYIQSFNPFLVDNTLSQYLDINGNSLSIGLSAPEIIFNSKQYAISNSLSSIDTSNQFTLSFYGTSNDWQKPLGYQLIGNFVGDGFGLFNLNTVTPSIFVQTVTGTVITNNDLLPIKQLTYESIPLGYIRFEGMRDYYGIFDDNTIRRYDATDIPLQVNTLPINTSSILDYSVQDEQNTYFLCNTAVGVSYPSIYHINLNTAETRDVTDVYTVSGFINYPPNYSTVTYNQLNATTINYYRDKLYLTPGRQARRIGHLIYYISEYNTSLIRWDLTENTTTTAFVPPATVYSGVTDQIRDFNIDVNEDLWIIDNTARYYKYSLDRHLLLSGAISTTTEILTTIQFTNDGTQTVFESEDLSKLQQNNQLTATTPQVNERTITTVFSAISSNTHTVVTTITPEPVATPIDKAYGSVLFNRATYDNGNSIVIITPFGAPNPKSTASAFMVTPSCGGLSNTLKIANTYAVPINLFVTGSASGDVFINGQNNRAGFHTHIGDPALVTAVLSSYTVCNESGSTNLPWFFNYSTTLKPGEVITFQGKNAMTTTGKPDLGLQLSIAGAAYQSYISGLPTSTVGFNTQTVNDGAIIVIGANNPHPTTRYYIPRNPNPPPPPPPPGPCSLTNSGYYTSLAVKNTGISKFAKVTKTTASSDYTPSSSLTLNTSNIFRGTNSGNYFSVGNVKRTKIPGTNIELCSNNSRAASLETYSNISNECNVTSKVFVRNANNAADENLEVYSNITKTPSSKPVKQISKCATTPTVSTAITAPEQTPAKAITIPGLNQLNGFTFGGNELQVFGEDTGIPVCGTTTGGLIVNKSVYVVTIECTGSVDDDIIFNHIVWEDGKYPYIEYPGPCKHSGSNGAHEFSPYYITLKPNDALLIQARDNGYGGGVDCITRINAVNYAGVSKGVITVFDSTSGTQTTPLTTISEKVTDSVVVVKGGTQKQKYVAGVNYVVQGSKIIFFSPPIDNTIALTTKIPFDTYKNESISFINDFTGGEYIQSALITRVSQDPNVNSLSSVQINKIKLDGVQQLSAVFEGSYYANGIKNNTNDDYLRNVVYSKYTAPNLNAKTTLTNIYNDKDTVDVEVVTCLSGLDPGAHHFAVRFDSYHGEMALFIDGVKIGDVNFAPRKYKFSNLIKRPFMFGTATFKNNIPLFKYLKNNSFLADNLSISNYNLYNTPLNDSDIQLLARQGMKIHDIVVDIPCGKRNYLEEVERYFKAAVPGSKSTLYNLIINNTGITDPALKEALATRIANELANIAPVYTQLNQIKWIN
jgi:hypothetical protein